MLKILKFVVIAVGAGIATRLLVIHAQGKVADAVLDEQMRVEA